ncbi:MAG: lamin tail domain-containing protein, partial [Planctomycetales bacterium]|nr:lamin tail domain-containing protein [Planctomycetales bacterium]
ANVANLQDEDHEVQDWIEVANLGDTDMSLAGWALTDDVAAMSKWSFPDVTLPAGEHLIVYASAKDRAVAGNPLHTNFRLDADGEYLALTQDGVVVHSYGPSYPQQVADVSYGMFGVNQDVGYFAVPTPGAPNSQAPNQVPPQAIVINEIMYHPASEQDAEEYIELLNYGTQAIDLSGWRISGGIDLSLPGITLAAGQTLVLAADVDAFHATYGAGITAYGPWTGRLSNQSDTIRLRDNQDRVVDRVTYADEGDWALRGRWPEDRRGWIWLDDHDGGGKSLELTNPRLPNEYGQNWQASATNGGTPGSLNSRAAANVAPLVIDVQQTPIIPRPGEAVT